MRTIDMQNWPRREHFKFYGTFDHPHFGMCVNVELTNFLPAVRQRRISFTIALIYVITRAANAIPEFRYRIRGEQVIEHEVVHASTTILGEEDVFSFCTLDYCEDFSQYAAQSAARIARAREHPVVEDIPGQDDLLYMTAIPWVSFTSFMHPIHLKPPDSIPRFTWGKYFEEGKSLKMPLGVQVHHALMDGLHVGRYYAKVQELLNDPSFLVDST
jgi:chloramphenicol O-acetyltransferase type A